MKNVTNIDLEEITQEEMNKYMKPIIEYGLPIDGVPFFIYKGTKYMIGQIDSKEEGNYDSYVISYEDKGKMKAMFSFEAGGEISCQKDGYYYSISPDVATIGFAETGDSDQLMYLDQNSDVPVSHKVLVYMQCYDDKKIIRPVHNTLITTYDTDGCGDVNAILEYIQDRRPSTYQFSQERIKDVNKVIKERKYMFDKGYFYRFKIDKDEKVLADKRRAYTFDAIKYIVENEGYKTIPPKELIRLYKGNLELFNDIRNITNVYKDIKGR